MSQFDVDVLIVGAGPGGLQVAHDLHSAGASYLVVDASDSPGSFFRRFPRHRQLISVNKCVVAGGDTPLRFDWNSLLTDENLRFTGYSSEYLPAADDMTRYLADVAAKLDLAIRYNTTVLAIEPAFPGYTAIVEAGPPLNARRVVMATGLVPYTPAIPGIEHVERYADFPTDPGGFHDARVLIVGKGNSAFETATSLIPAAASIHLASPSPLRLAWNTHYVGHLRACNSAFIDTYQLKIGNAVLDAEITAIRRDGAGFDVDMVYTHADEHRVTYQYDRVIAACGFRFDPTALAALDIETSHGGRFPAMTPEYECPSAPGLYFAGTVTHARDYRKTMSGFIHGFRYNARFLARLLSTGVVADASLPAEPAAVAQWALRRINTSDALYLQPGYLADVVVANCTGQLELYTGVPLDWVRAGGLGHGWRAAVTLAYGPPAADPMRIDRSQSSSYAEITPFLHPVIHLLGGSGELDRLHLLEDLHNRYSERECLPALTSFFRTALTHREVTASHAQISR